MKLHWYPIWDPGFLGVSGGKEDLPRERADDALPLREGTAHAD